MGQPFTEEQQQYLQGFCTALLQTGAAPQVDMASNSDIPITRDVKSSVGFECAFVSAGVRFMQIASTRWIDEWNPEDPTFWERAGKRIAWRNLIWSILAENLGFSIWLIWSVVAAQLPKAGFSYSTQELFQLVALPGLIGALLRFPYTFAVPKFGGRNWTVIS